MPPAIRMVSRSLSHLPARSFTPIGGLAPVTFSNFLTPTIQGSSTTTITYGLTTPANSLVVISFTTNNTDVLVSANVDGTLPINIDRSSGTLTLQTYIGSVAGVAAGVRNFNFIVANTFGNMIATFWALNNTTVGYTGNGSGANLSSVVSPQGLGSFSVSAGDVAFGMYCTDSGGGTPDLANSSPAPNNSYLDASFFHNATGEWTLASGGTLAVNGQNWTGSVGVTYAFAAYR